MTMNELALHLCAEETGKQEVNIAQMKQILKILAVNVYENPEVLMLLMKHGKKISDGSN